MENKVVAVLGASDKPNRYSNMAVKSLLSKGYTVIPVNPVLEMVENTPAVPGLHSISEPVHTVTLYVASRRMDSFTDALLALAPRRVIFNPGTENAEVEKKLIEHNIQTIRACTLVMLNTGQF